MGKQAGKKSARKAKKAAASSRHPPETTTAVSKKPLLTIRAQTKGEEPVQHVVMSDAGPTILKMARQWAYVLRVRTRWAGDPDMRDYFGTRAMADLGKIGVTEELLRQLALFDHIEIELNKWDQAGNDAPEIVDAASEISWEYLLSAATRSVGRFESLLITRCLPNGAPVTSTRPRRMLFVESAPGRIQQKYEFDDEETRIGAAVNLEEDYGLTFARTDPYSALEKKVSAEDWQAIHVTGVDTHQAAWLIEGFYDAVARKADVIDKSDRLHDGMILRGDHDSELPVRYNELADLLDKSKKAPRVVTLNLYYSGARTSRELVRRGAHAALGFLDEIDDEFAEHFFQAFYWAWCHSGKSIPIAFLDAWKAMDSDRMHGTSIVIWLGSSMVGLDRSQKKMAAKPAAQRRRGAR
jgi:hypothetical protein